MRAGWVVVTGLAALLMATPADAQPPIKDGDTLSGTLRLVRTRHPNGTKIEAYQIVSAPRAMPADDDFCESGKGVTTFHLFTMTDAARKQFEALARQAGDGEGGNAFLRAHRLAYR
jgi:hypothetical protein